MTNTRHKLPLVPAKAGTQSGICRMCGLKNWLPAFAGMSGVFDDSGDTDARA